MAVEDVEVVEDSDLQEEDEAWAEVVEVVVIPTWD